MRFGIRGFILLVAIVLSSAVIQDRVEAQTAVTVNPIDLVNGYANFEVDTPLLPLMSFHAGLDFLVWEGVWSDSAGDVLAVGPLMGLRFYPFLGAPTGLWAGPYAGISYVHLTDGSDEVTRAGLSTGVMVGLTAILADIFVLSGGVGVGYHDLSEVINGSQVGPNTVSPRFRLALGAAF